jgi:hypothetical protein
MEHALGWAAALLDAFRKSGELLAAAPTPLLAAIALSPTLIALISRALPLAAVILPLNLALILALLAPIGTELKAAILLASIGVFAGLLGSGRSAARMRSSVDEIQHRVRQLETNMATFCDALDRRTQIVDRELMEVAKRRNQADDKPAAAAAQNAVGELDRV